MKTKKTKSERIKSFRFQHIYLENWQNFPKVDEDLQRRVFLVGPNASGKSNFLNVFRFLHDIAAVGGGLQPAVEKRGGVSRLRAWAARRYSDILIRVRIENGENSSKWEYEICFSQNKQKQPIVKSERVIKDGTNILIRPDEDDKKDPRRLTQTAIQQVNINHDFRELVDFFTSIRYLHIVPQLIREPDRSTGRKHDPYGGDFLENIASTVEKTRKARLNKISEALRVAVPQLKEIILERDEKNGKPHLRGKYASWRSEGVWQNEDQFSDGTLRLMGLLWATLDGNGPLLLEEPELSLHPEVVRYLPQMFHRLQRRTGRQIILSTHSFDLLRDDGIGLDEVFMLKPTNDGTNLQSPKQRKQIEGLLKTGGISLAEYVIEQTRPEHAEQLTFFGDWDNGG